MTREEIIEQLDAIVGTYEILIGNGVNSDILDVDDIEAIKEAISALSENKGDLISRKDAIQALKAEGLEELCRSLGVYPWNVIKMIPSVHSKYPNKAEKGGEWINNENGTFTCNKCGEISCCNSKFCCECGARMKGSAI